MRMNSEALCLLYTYVVSITPLQMHSRHFTVVKDRLLGNQAFLYMPHAQSGMFTPLGILSITTRAHPRVDFAY